MTQDDPDGAAGRAVDLRAVVIEALVAANLPEDARPTGADQLLGVDLEPPALPSVLERGLRQIEVSAQELWIRTLTAEVGLESLRREVERTQAAIAAIDDKRSKASDAELSSIRRDVDRLETAIAKLDERRWSEGRVLAALALLVGLAAGLAKLTGLG